MDVVIPIVKVRHTLHFVAVFIAAVFLVCGQASADEISETESTVGFSGSETTIDSCRDGQDNDGDHHVDCDDQDCHVFVICGPTLLRQAVAAEKMDPPAKAEGEGTGQSIVVQRTDPEMGLQCRDEKDNNNNGLVDCGEPSCQDSEFCHDKIFYVPEPSDKPAGLLLSLGVGFAFPNWSPPSGETTQGEVNYVIPYLPDIGPLGELCAEYIFIKWMGFGVKGMIAATGVQSRNDWSDEDYKFDGLKAYFFAGGFVRFQYPFERLVPFINIAGGYSYVQYRWVTFSRFEETGEMSKTLDRIMEPPSHHATFAFEVGLDVYLIKRYIAAGFKAWLPIAATSDSGMDNTAAMLTLTWTPLWPEEETIRPEFLGDSE
ncbi:MAG: hypothetical protein GY854_16885 [Deltaproteobacteria bacterium]|nr:hypothetical protein [Deltaproteobacteria bacterium]